MSHFIHTGIYYQDIRNYNSDVIHLYEHLLIRTFEKKIVESGFSPYLYGWVSGETFRNAVFIDYGFYHPEVEKLFHSFMQSSSHIDLSAVDLEVTRIEAEMMSIITVSDALELRQLLKEYDSQPWHDIEQDLQSPLQKYRPVPQVNPSLWSEQRSKKSFKQISVIVGLSNATDQDKAVFLRLTPIIFDAINRTLFARGLYQNDNSWPTYHTYGDQDAMSGLSIFTLRRGTFSLRALSALAAEAIIDLELTSHDQELRHYFNGFVGTPTWNTFPISYFKYSGMLVSRRLIRELATPERIQTILKKCEIKTVNTVPEHWDVCR